MFYAPPLGRPGARARSTVQVCRQWAVREPRGTGDKIEEVQSLRYILAADGQVLDLQNSIQDQMVWILPAQCAPDSIRFLCRYHTT